MNTPSQPSKALSFIGLAFVVLILVLAYVSLYRDQITQSSLTRLESQAFGALTAGEQTNPQALNSRTGAGGGGQESDSSAAITNEFIMPELQVRYDYVFDGDLPDLSSIDPTVYRRVSQSPISDALSQSFANQRVGDLSLSAFSNLELRNLSLQENNEQGYNIYLDSFSNSISISRNSGYWADIDYARVFTATDIPADDALIASAQTFLSRYGINTSDYGQPQVDRSYLDPEVWVPESMQVVYPFTINNQDVWSMWGQPSGLSLSVSLRTSDVESAWIPSPYTLEASAYQLTTDPTQVLAVAQRGGLWEYAPENPQTTYTFTLGTPEVILAEYTQYINNESSTLYVPALRFAVTDGPADAPYQRPWVIVPLVQDLLTDAEQTNREPVLFLEEPAARSDEPKAE